MGWFDLISILLNILIPLVLIPYAFLWAREYQLLTNLHEAYRELLVYEYIYFSSEFEKIDPNRFDIKVRSFIETISELTPAIDDKDIFFLDKEELQSLPTAQEISHHKSSKEGSNLLRHGINETCFLIQSLYFRILNPKYLLRIGQRGWNPKRVPTYEYPTKLKEPNAQS